MTMTRLYAIVPQHTEGITPHGGYSLIEHR
jgi:hypothetical protein